MATTVSPTTTRMRRAPRASSAATARGDGREAQYDLLTAALMGMAVGAGITFMLRRGPSGRRPISPALTGAGRGIAWAGERGGEMWEKVPRDEIRRNVRKGLASAKDTIDDAVEAELRALRRSIRRRRKQLGL